MDAVPYHIPDPEDLVMCPYCKNPGQRIAVKRMQYHLMKCRRNHKGQAFVVCPFNATHEMPKAELRYHMTMCPDKARIAADLEYEFLKSEPGGARHKGYTDAPSYKYDFDTPEPTEDWESEISSVPMVGVRPSTLNNPNIIKDTVGIARFSGEGNQDLRMEVITDLRLSRAEKKAHHQNLFKISTSSEDQSKSDVRCRPPLSTVKPEEQTTASSIYSFSTGKFQKPTVGVGRGIAQTRKDQKENSALAIWERAVGKGKPGNSGFVKQVQKSNLESKTQGTSWSEKTLEDRQKEEKKLHKKLRQIQILEDKQDKGEELLPTEHEKVSKREEIEMALKNLNLNC